MKGHIFQRKRRRSGDDANRPARKSKQWYMRWKADGPGGTWSKPINLGVRDKQVAQEKCNHFIRNAEREAAGVTPPKSLRDGAASPLLDELVKYVSDLRAKGKDDKYIENIELHVHKLLKECGWKMAGDVTATGFITWRSRQAKKSGKTLNDYLSDMGGLLKWMHRLGRITANPLGEVERAKVLQDESPRRALAPEEVDRLLALDTPFHLVYFVKLTTGLRRAELERLIWADVSLDEAHAFIWAAASTTKNGRRMSLPLRRDVLHKLSEARPADARPSDSVFRRLPTMDEFRSDCDRAGIDHRPDARGRVVVFHSLRHTLCTDLSRNGVALAVTMTIMRHTDSKLSTKRYLDNNLLPIGDAIRGLSRGVGGTQAGTQATAQTGQSVSSAVNRSSEELASEVLENAEKTTVESTAVSLSHIEGENSAGRTRTYNQSVNSRLLYH